MTTYSAIANGEIDALSPVTDLLLTRFRDNPIAIAEGDPSVPLELQLTPLLGTLTTTSGTSQTLSGLVLTNYKFLRVVYRGVTHAGSTGAHTIAGVNVLTAVTTSTAIRGGWFIDLSDGTLFGAGQFGTTAQAAGQSTSITNASTSISFGSPTFTGGTIRVYGEK